MVGLDRNKHAGSLSNAKRNVQIQVKTGLLGAYDTLNNVKNIAGLMWKIYWYISLWLH